MHIYTKVVNDSGRQRRGLSIGVSHFSVRCKKVIFFFVSILLWSITAKCEYENFCKPDHSIRFFLGFPTVLSPKSKSSSLSLSRGLKKGLSWHFSAVFFDRVYLQQINGQCTNETSDWASANSRSILLRTFSCVCMYVCMYVYIHRSFGQCCI